VRTAGLSLLALFVVATTAVAEWRPAPAPLVTRWAKDVSPTKALPKYPRPQMRREAWQSLNGLWQFAIAGEKDTPPFGKELSEAILVPFPVESALSGIGKHAERLWYRRAFTVPKEWADQRLLLHFGAVDWEAIVWVNGTRVASHRGGYDGFSCDITDALKKDGEQELIVGVWDPTDGGTQPRGKQVRNPSGIFYTPTTGIWQTVWLEPVHASAIADLKIVPDVAGGKAVVVVTSRDPDARSTVTLTCRDGKESVSATKGRIGEPIHLILREPKLWSPESPFLYDLHIEVVEKGKVVDAVDSYFGMRSVAVQPDSKGAPRLFLNGKPYFQVGPLDQGFWPDGIYTAPTDAALRFDIEITKKLGFNMTRKHVKVEPDRWYYWCDKLGLLVWQDMPSGDRSIGGGDPDIVRTEESAKQHEAELKALIDGRRNHPSIILWVVFNEGWGQYETARLTKWTKDYDPSRLADCASGWADRGVGDVHDIHVYPGPGAPKVEKVRAGVLGEFGGLGLGVDGHTWAKKNWSYSGTSSKAELTRRYERLLQQVYRLRDEAGLSAAVYTQITDVETEINGLLTYDREVEKVDLERAAAANRGDFSRVPMLQELVATSKTTAQTWRYTTERPGAGWFKPEFDDSAWKSGPGGFGTKGTPGAVVRTEWNTDDIWIRREIMLPDAPTGDLYLNLHHDEDAEVYINGQLVAKVSGYTTDYEEVAISPEGRVALKAGKNVIAVHCHQTTGGQYIDLGISSVKARR
jgi:hypothetical protein